LQGGSGVSAFLREAASSDHAFERDLEKRFALPSAPQGKRYALEALHGNRESIKLSA
jgi:hypothetical protein